MKLSRLAIVFLTLWAGQVAALDEWLQVEAIVFLQEDPQREEAYPTDPQLGLPSGLRILQPAPDLRGSAPASAELNERLAALMVPEAFLTRDRARAKMPFVALDKDQRQLNPEAFTLERSDNYRVLFHQAWRQPAKERGAAPWVLVQGGRELAGTPEMAGALRIFQERFLHAEANLWHAAELSPSREDANSADTPATGQKRGVILPRVPEPGPPLRIEKLERIDRARDLNRSESASNSRETNTPEALATAPAVDLLRRSEQIRPEKRHYLDHPRLGVLMLVTPIEREEDRDDEKTVPPTLIPQNP